MSDNTNTTFSISQCSNALISSLHLHRTFTINSTINTTKFKTVPSGITINAGTKWEWEKAKNMTTAASLTLSLSLHLLKKVHAADLPKASPEFLLLNSALLKCWNCQKCISFPKIPVALPDFNVLSRGQIILPTSTIPIFPSTLSRI